MNSKHSITLCLTLAVAMIAVPGRGGETNNHAAPPARPPVGRQVVQDTRQWDLNQDGKVDPSEHDAARRQQVKAQRAEREARAMAAAETRRTEELARRTRLAPPAVVTKFDANQDGLLDEKEWKSYHADLKKRRELRQAQTPPPGAK